MTPVGTEQQSSKASTAAFLPRIKARPARGYRSTCGEVWPGGPLQLKGMSLLASDVTAIHLVYPQLQRSTSHIAGARQTFDEQMQVLKRLPQGAGVGVGEHGLPFNTGTLRSQPKLNVPLLTEMWGLLLQTR